MHRIRWILPTVVALFLLALPAPPAHAIDSMRHATVPPPEQVHDGVLITVSIALVTLTLLAGMAALMAWNFRRGLAYGVADAWEDPHYQKDLPNALARLGTQAFTSPWPRHCNPWSMRRFERKLIYVLRPLLRHRTAAFVEQHISVWIWVAGHRDACREVLRARKVERALEFLTIQDMPYQHDAVLAFLESPAAHIRQFDRKTIRRLDQLQRLQIIMREHGYNISPEFGERDVLERTPKEELVELILPRRHGR